MRPWSTLFPDVLPAAMSLPEPTVVHHIRRAAQDFCRRTRAWRELLDPVQTIVDEQAYDLEMPPGAELVRIEAATFNGEPIALWRQGSGVGRYLHTGDGKMVQLSFSPGAIVPLVVDASLTPSNAAPGLPVFLFDRYADVLAAGAIARLTGDEIKAGQFQAQCDRIKTDLWRGMAATRPRTVPNYF